MPHLDTRPGPRRRSGRAGHAPTDDALSDDALTNDRLADDALTHADLTDDAETDTDLADDAVTDDDALDDGAPDDAADGWVDPDRLDGAALARWRRSQRRRRRDDPDLDLDVALDPPAGGGRRREPPWPLWRATPPADPFPVDALGPDLAAAARAIEARTLAPLALCGQAVLGAAALAAQAQADVLLPDGRRRPLSLALLSVAAAGERLGAVADFAWRAVRQHERRLHAAHAGELAAYDTERAAWRGARRGGKDRDRAALRAHLEAAGPAPAPPRTPVLLASDPTSDGLLRLLAEGQASMGLFTAEASSLIAGPGLSRRARRRMAAALSRLWDDGGAERTRARDGVVTLYGKRLSLHLATSPGEGLAGLAGRDGADPRLAGRLLGVMPTSTIGTRFLSDDSEARIAATQGDLDRFEARIAALLRAAPRVIELEQRPLPLAPDAARRWRAFSNEVEAAMAAGGVVDDVGALAATAAEQVARIAGVLTIYGDGDARDIPAEAVAGAIDLVRHYLAEARRIAGLAGEQTELRQAQAVLDYITRLGQPVVHLVDIYQNGPRAVRDAATARAALRLLERHGHVEELYEGAVVDGLRRRDAWRVVAVVAAAKAAKAAEKAEAAKVAKAAEAARAAEVAEAAKAAKAAKAARAAKAAKVASAAQPAKAAEGAARATAAATARPAEVAKVAAAPASAAAVRPPEAAHRAAAPASAIAGDADDGRSPLSLPPEGEGGAQRRKGDAAADSMPPGTTDVVGSSPFRPFGAPSPAGGRAEGAAGDRPSASPAGSPADVAKVAKVPAPPASALAALLAKLTAAGPSPVSEAGAGSGRLDPGTAGVPPAPERAAGPRAQVVADVVADAASLDTNGVPLAWAEGVARLDPRAPPPDFTPWQWSAFVEACGRLLEDHGGALHATGWTAPEIFGFHPRAPWRALEIAGLALFLVATPGASVVEIRPDGMIYDRPGPGRGPYWRTRPRRSGVAAWLVASPGRAPADGQDDRR